MLPTYIGTKKPMEVSLEDVRNSASGVKAILRYGDEFEDGVR